MITFLIIWCVLIGILFVIHFFRSEWRDKRKLEYLNKVLKLQENREEELTDILDWIKQYRESIRANRVDAAYDRKEAEKVAEKVVSKVDEKAEELKTEMKELPEKVAEVVKGDKESPSGRNTIPDIKGKT